MLAGEERAELTQLLRSVNGFVCANNFADFDRVHARLYGLLSRWSDRRAEEPHKTESGNNGKPPTSYDELHAALAKLTQQKNELNTSIGALRALLVNSEAEVAKLKEAQPSLVERILQIIGKQ